MQASKSFIHSKLLPVIVIGALALGAGVWAARLLVSNAPEADPLSATRFPAARTLAQFSLTDHNGNTFDNASLTGNWSFLFFGYTQCPDICPITLSLLNSVAQQLGKHGEKARFVMVTVDPARDTPEILGKYVTWFNGDFIGVTGSDTELQQLTKQLGIMYMQVNNSDDPNAYLVDHTAGVFLFDPDGRYHAVFTPPLTVDAIAADFKAMARSF